MQEKQDALASAQQNVPVVPTQMSSSAMMPPHWYSWHLILHWPEIEKVAQSLAHSKAFMRRVYKDGRWVELPSPPSDIAWAMGFGASLGLDPFNAALRLRLGPNGTMLIPAELMRARLVQAGYDFDITIIRDEKGKPVAAEMVTWKTDNPSRKWGPSRFTLEEAEAAGLVKDGGAWTTYTEDMLVARVTARHTRRYHPQVMAGTYIPEEFGMMSGGPAAPHVVIAEEDESGAPTAPAEDVIVAEVEMPGGEVEVQQQPLYEWPEPLYEKLMRYAEELEQEEEIKRAALAVRSEDEAMALCARVADEVRRVRAEKKQAEAKEQAEDS